MLCGAAGLEARRRRASSSRPQALSASQCIIDLDVKLIDRYIVREVLTPFLFALGMFTFVFGVQPALNKAQNLLAKGVDLGTVGFLLLTLLPQALGLSLPMAFLAGLLMGLGRLSGDREAVALLACGVSPLRILRPVLLLAVVAGGLDMYVLMQLIPDANQAFRVRTTQILATKSESDIRPGTFYEGFPGQGADRPGAASRGRLEERLARRHERAGPDRS